MSNVIHFFISVLKDESRSVCEAIVKTFHSSMTNFTFIGATCSHWVQKTLKPPSESLKCWECSWLQRNAYSKHMPELTLLRDCSAS